MSLLKAFIGALSPEEKTSLLAAIYKYETSAGSNSNMQFQNVSRETSAKPMTVHTPPVQNDAVPVGGIVQNGPVQDGTEQNCAVQVGTVQNGVGQNGAGQNGAGQVGAGQVGAGQSGFGQVGTAMPKLPIDSNLMKQYFESFVNELSVNTETEKKRSWQETLFEGVEEEL